MNIEEKVTKGKKEDKHGEGEEINRQRERREEQNVKWNKTGKKAKETNCQLVFHYPYIVCTMSR